MALYNIPNASGGLDNFMVDLISEVVPTGLTSVFIPMFLFFVFGVVLIGGTTAQKRRSTTVDLPMWFTMASLSTFMVALPLTLRSGLIDITTLSIVVAVTLMSGVWLFFDRNRREA